MRPRLLCVLAGLMIPGLLCFFVIPQPASGVFLYKSYIVQQDGGIDILCAPHQVQDERSVTGIFAQRGNITEADYPEFTQIFKRLNPHIVDTNRLEPGQRVTIPIKKLKKDTLVGQDTGAVTIPLVTVTNLQQFIKNYSAAYTVQRQDWVSKLVARGYGKFGTNSYREGIELFKLLNPQVTDLNRIEAGQILLLPKPSIRNESWYASLFDDSGRITRVEPPVEPASRPKRAVAVKKESNPAARRMADIVGGSLSENGVLYFPRTGSEDLRLDLSQTPLLELNNGSRIIFAAEMLPSDDLRLIETHWKNTKLIPLNPESRPSEIMESALGVVDRVDQNRISLSDRGLTIDVQAKWIIKRPMNAGMANQFVCVNLIEAAGEGTDTFISAYLKKQGVIVKDIMLTDLSENGDSGAANHPRDKDNAVEDMIAIGSSNPRGFVQNVLMAMGIRYVEPYSIDFPYAGNPAEISTTLVSGKDGQDFIVDYGELQGDVIQAIERTGVSVVQVNKADPLSEIVQRLLDITGRAYTRNPRFLASERPEAYNTALTVPGFLVKNNDSPNTLLAAVPLHDDVVGFLMKIGVNVIMVVHSENRA